MMSSQSFCFQSELLHFACDPAFVAQGIIVDTKTLYKSTDSWTISEMDVLGHIVYGRDFW